MIIRSNSLPASSSAKAALPELASVTVCPKSTSISTELIAISASSSTNKTRSNFAVSDDATGGLTGSSSVASEVAGNHNSAVVPSLSTLVSSSAPFIWTATPWIIESPSPVPLPGPLVEKNGSIALLRVAASMPWPVSETERTRYSRAHNSPRVAERRSCLTESTSFPPLGIASLALIARLSSASSTWLASISALGNCRGRCFSSSIF